MGNCQSARVSPAGHPSKRRKSSISVLLADAQLASLASPSRQLSTQASSVKDYRRFATSAERVAAAFKAYKRDILDTHGSSESTLDFDRNTIRDFMEAQKTFGLTDAELLMLHEEIEYQQVVEKKEANPHKTFWLFLKTTLGYIDLGTDIKTMVNYVPLNPIIAIAQGVVLGFSFFVQFLTSVGLGQPFWVGVVGLFGMKPMLEAWREAMDAKPFPGQRGGNDQMLFITRFIELVVSRWVV